MTERLKPWDTPQASPLWSMLPEIHQWNLDNMHNYTEEDINFEPIRKGCKGWRDDSWMSRSNGQLNKLVKGQSTGYQDLAEHFGYKPSWFWCAALMYVREYGEEEICVR